MSGKEIKLKQGKIPKALLPGYEWETFGGKGKRIKNGKEIKLKQGKIQSGIRRFNRGGKV